MARFEQKSHANVKFTINEAGTKSSLLKKKLVKDDICELCGTGAKQTTSHLISTCKVHTVGRMDLP